MKSTSHVACVEVVWCYKLINSQLITLDRGERGTRYIQRYNNHSWAWRLIHRLSLPRLFLPKLTAALQKTVKHFYFKSAPVFPTESAVRGPSLRFFLFFFFFFGTHHPNDRMRRGSKKKKRSKNRDPSFVISSSFQHRHISDSCHSLSSGPSGHHSLQLHRIIPCVPSNCVQDGATSAAAQLNL